jgi:predicted enzyme related to lactoylglutathione lyase
MKSYVAIIIIATTASACCKRGLVREKTREGAKVSESKSEHVHHAIDYVELAVTSLADAKQFYGAAFGWQFNDYGPAYAGIKSEAGDEMGGLREEPNVQPGGPLIVLYSRDLDATLQSVKKAGGKIIKQPFAFPGGRRFHFADPSGNELAVWSPR